MTLRRRFVAAVTTAAALALALTGCSSDPDSDTSRSSAAAKASAPGVRASADTEAPARKASITNPTKPCDAMSAKKLNQLLGDKDATYGAGRMEDLGSYALVTDMTYDPRECEYKNEDGNIISVSTYFGYQSMCGTEVCTADHPYQQLKKIATQDYKAMAKTVGEYRNLDHQTLSLRPNGDDEVVGAEFATLRFFDGYTDGTCVTDVCKTHIAADFFYSYELKGVNASSLIVVSGTNVTQPQIMKIMNHAVHTGALFPKELMNK